MNTTLNANSLKIDPISPLRGGDIGSNETKMMLKYNDMVKTSHPTAFLVRGNRIDTLQCLKWRFSNIWVVFEQF